MLKIIFLFLGVWLTIVNISKTAGNDPIPAWSFVVQAIGIVGFIVLQFNLL